MLCCLGSLVLRVTQATSVVLGDPPDLPPAMLGGGIWGLHVVPGIQLGEVRSMQQAWTFIHSSCAGNQTQASSLKGRCPAAEPPQGQGIFSLCSSFFLILMLLIEHQSLFLWCIAVVWAVALCSRMQWVGLSLNNASVGQMRVFPSLFCLGRNVGLSCSQII